MNTSEVQTIITADPTGEKLVDFAARTAEQLVKENLKRSQIRNIFTEVRKIEALWEAQSVKSVEERDFSKALNRLVMLKPKMDYQTARIDEVKRLRDVLSEAIDVVVKGATPEEQSERFKRFMNLFEAILAYHHAKGGKN